MGEGSKKYADFREYLKDCPEDVRFRLLAIMKIIREVVPIAEERISYNMPAYFYKGRLVYFCAFKNHIGFYPASMTVFTAFRKELSGYVQSGHGTVRFQHGEPYCCLFWRFRQLCSFGDAPEVDVFVFEVK